MSSKLKTEITGEEDGFFHILNLVENFCLCAALKSLFTMKIYNYMHSKKKSSTQDIANSLALDPTRLEAFLLYLRNAGLVLKDSNGLWSVSDKLVRMQVYQPWIEMMIGGYGITFLNLYDGLKDKNLILDRNEKYVGSGSCGISQFGALPLVKELIYKHELKCDSVLDIGCGNGNYLYSLSQMLGKIEAYGIEPSEAVVLEANNYLSKLGVSHHIKVFKGSAKDFDKVITEKPKVILICFVLHEILAQEGKQGVINFLKKIKNYFPLSKVVVIEIDEKFSEIKNKKIEQGYYNPYFLLHFFTNQKLETADFWRNMFADIGFKILEEKKISNKLDDTGIEVGFLLSS